MRRPALLVLLLVIAACSPAPNASAPAATARPAVAPPPPPPAKAAHMVCRNSQTGAAVQCGTPNAVMVGIAQDP